jgi:hypothetical protein
VGSSPSPATRQEIPSVGIFCFRMYSWISCWCPRFQWEFFFAYFVSRMSGKPSLPAQITTIFAFREFASFSVASIPFHRSNWSLIPLATIVWKSAIPCASILLRTACAGFLVPPEVLFQWIVRVRPAIQRVTTVQTRRLFLAARLRIQFPPKSTEKGVRARMCTAPSLRIQQSLRV